MKRIYFHDAEHRTVYSVPSEPQVVKKPDGSVFISTEWTITSADNKLDPHTGRWAERTSQQQSETYPPKDADQALSFFKMFKYPHFPEISPEESQHLQKQYETEASNNKG